MAIKGVQIDPTYDDAATKTRQFQSMPVLTAGTADSQTAAWCVAIEPIKAQSIGRVAVSGVVQIKSSDINKVVGALVIWRNDYWSLVRIDAVARMGKVTSMWTKGYSADVTVINADGTDTSSPITFSAFNHFAAVLGSTDNPKKVACVNIGGMWILIAAEC